MPEREGGARLADGGRRLGFLVAYSVFEVTVRTSDHLGDDFLVPEAEVDILWTNLFESSETIIALYHDQGTSEQFHSELKTDMDVERPPSGSMKVNELVLTISMLAFNTLQYIGQSALSPTCFRSSPISSSSAANSYSTDGKRFC